LLYTEPCPFACGCAASLTQLQRSHGADSTTGRRSSPQLLPGAAGTPRVVALGMSSPVVLVCLIDIQPTNVFFPVFAPGIGKILVFSDDFKTAFLQPSYRPGVVRCCPGENRPIYNKAEHPIERLSRWSSSPEPSSKPIGDFCVFSMRIARYVTSDLSLCNDRPRCVL